MRSSCPELVLASLESEEIIILFIVDTLSESSFSECYVHKGHISIEVIISDISDEEIEFFSPVVVSVSIFFGQSETLKLCIELSFLSKFGVAEVHKVPLRVLSLVRHGFESVSITTHMHVNIGVSSRVEVLIRM